MLKKYHFFTMRVTS